MSNIFLIFWYADSALARSNLVAIFDTSPASANANFPCRYIFIWSDSSSPMIARACLAYSAWKHTITLECEVKLSS
ncbi:hypothetical protein EDD21DRAFT_382940 [Dissophora ornata]|nr:hypothetical protein EDD21DRAFT_382940 [Dissophora ornata]